MTTVANQNSVSGQTAFGFDTAPSGEFPSNGMTSPDLRIVGPGNYFVFFKQRAATGYRSFRPNSVIFVPKEMHAFYFFWKNNKLRGCLVNRTH
jgi:hypothetical protein